MTEERRQGTDRLSWDNLLLEFAELSGKVVEDPTLNGYRMGGGCTRQWSRCSPAIFRRLVREGRINPDGTLKEKPPAEAEGEAQGS